MPQKCAYTRHTHTYPNDTGFIPLTLGPAATACRRSAFTRAAPEVSTAGAVLCCTPLQHAKPPLVLPPRPRRAQCADEHVVFPSHHEQFRVSWAACGRGFRILVAASIDILYTSVYRTPEWQGMVTPCRSALMSVLHRSQLHHPAGAPVSVLQRLLVKLAPTAPIDRHLSSIQDKCGQRRQP